ncbi:MAG: hypothetical protein RL154_757 [Pseudomonadota bacterium]|jgi:hydrogenase nickel incorporation protein HypA/HybF
MHEYSIVQSLIDSCEDYCTKNSATKATRVIIEIGEFSGVEPHLLQVAFDAFKEQSEATKESILEIGTKKNSDEMLLLRLELQ